MIDADKLRRIQNKNVKFRLAERMDGNKTISAIEHLQMVLPKTPGSGGEKEEIVEQWVVDNQSVSL